MSNIIARRDFTARDFDGLKTKIQNYFASKFPLAANSFFEDDFLMVMVELAAFTGDQQNFYIDMAVNECMWDTVGQRENIVRLCKLLGYSPRGLSSSRATLQCTTETYTGTLLIEKGTKVQASSYGKTFEVSQDYLINGPVSFEIEALEGETHTDILYGDGTTYQKYGSVFDQISSTVVEIVEVDGTVWEKVPFLNGVLEGNYYEAQFVEGSRIQIAFGDGVHGNIPPDGAEIHLTYMTSSGSSGNVAALSISQKITGLVGVTPWDVTVVNEEASSGGDAEETVEEIRANAPVYFQSLGNLVTAKDFKGFCERYAGISKATVTVDPIMKTVTIYLMADGYTLPTEPLKEDILRDMQEIKLLGVVLELEDAHLVHADISAEIFIKSNYDVSQVQTSVAAAVKDHFNPDNAADTDREMGTDIHISDIDRLLDEVDGVDHLRLTKLARRPEARLIDWYGDSEFTALDIAENVSEEIWYITFETPTQYTVRGSQSGLQTNEGDVDVDYITDNGELTFRIRSGSVPNISGNRAEIKTSAYRDDIHLDDSEFALEGTLSWTFYFAD